MCSQISPREEPNDCKVNCSCRIWDTVKTGLTKATWELIGVRSQMDAGSAAAVFFSPHKLDPNMDLVLLHTSVRPLGGPAQLRATSDNLQERLVHRTTVSVASHRHTLILFRHSRVRFLFGCKCLQLVSQSYACNIWYFDIIWWKYHR